MSLIIRQLGAKNSPGRPREVPKMALRLLGNVFHGINMKKGTSPTSLPLFASLSGPSLGTSLGTSPRLPPQYIWLNTTI